MQNELLLRKPKGLHVSDLVEVSALSQSLGQLRALCAQAARIVSGIHH
jgi:hypothetical protein